jgi:DNA-directed RNA polymerase subunit L
MSTVKTGEVHNYCNEFDVHLLKKKKIKVASYVIGLKHMVDSSVQTTVLKLRCHILHIQATNLTRH